MSDFWNDQLVANDRQWLFLVLLGIVVSFGLIRMSTRLMRSPRTPWWPGSIVSDGGVHVHHLVFGIVLMMIAGTLTFACFAVSPTYELRALAFGVGIGLTIDEFALWLYLDKVYWDGPRTPVVDALVVAVASMGLILLGVRPFDSYDATALDLVTTVAAALVTLTCVVVCVFKHRLLHATGFVFPLAYYGAVRIGKPTRRSPSAGTATTGWPKQAKAARRFHADRRPDRLKESLPRLRRRLHRRAATASCWRAESWATRRTWLPCAPGWRMALAMTGTASGLPKRRGPRGQGGLQDLVRAKGGPPGAIAKLWRDGKTTVMRAGYADRAARRRPRSTDHMRIASIAKAFNDAVTRKPGPATAAGPGRHHRPALPGAARRMGARDRSPAAAPHQRGARLHQVRRLREASPDRPQGLRLPGQDHLLGGHGPAGLPSRLAVRVLEHRQHRDRADRRANHRPGLRRCCASTCPPPPTAARREQRRFFAGGRSSPPGPGANSAGLALFRYRTRCGTVYGHTGNFPGYVQWAAASSDGQRVVTTSLNIPAPEGALLKAAARSAGRRCLRSAAALKSTTTAGACSAPSIGRTCIRQPHPSHSTVSASSRGPTNAATWSQPSSEQISSAMNNQARHGGVFPGRLQEPLQSRRLFQPSSCLKAAADLVARQPAARQANSFIRAAWGDRKPAGMIPVLRRSRSEPA